MTEKLLQEYLKKLGCPSKRRQDIKQVLKDMNPTGPGALLSEKDFTVFFFRFLEWKAQTDLFQKYSSST